MATLRVISQTLQGQTFELDGDYVTIGREPDNIIYLDHTSVSKHHAMLTVDNGDFKLWDLHSTNGILVNGQPTVLSHLKDGDKIVFGEIELRFALNNNKGATQVLSPLPLFTVREPTVVRPPAIPVAPVLREAAALPVPPTKMEPPKPQPATPPPTEAPRKERHDAVAVTIAVAPAPPPPAELRSEPILVKPGESAKPAVEIVPQKHPPIEGFQPQITGRSYSGTALAVSVCLGVLLLIGGYSFDVNSFRLLGIVFTTTGIVIAIFRLRYGAIVAPPRKKF